MQDYRNVLITIDHLWAYNFIGGLKDQRDLSIELLGEVYGLTCQYIKERHNFHLTHKPAGFNEMQARVHGCSIAMDVDPDYVLFYCEAAYRAIIGSLSLVPNLISDVQSVANSLGDIVGFVVTVKDGRFQ